MEASLTVKTWVMTEDEKRQFNHMQNDVAAIKTEVATLGMKVDKMYIALMGSDIAKDGGLVGRIQQLETENEELREELDTIKTNAVKSDLYLKWIWGLVGAFGSGIFTYVLSLIFKK